MRTVSPEGRAWTAHSEGCALTAYPDNGAYSIGYGHRGVSAGTVWTQAQADAALDDDLYGAVCSLSLLLDAPVFAALAQGQLDALADFVFNEGAGKFASSTLRKLLNLGELVAARRELYWQDAEGGDHGWIYADGHIVAGLIARRKGEQVLWDGGNPLEQSRSSQV